MSHFTVLVIGPDVDSALIPFKEEGAPEQYLVFDDQEDKYRHEYENDSRDMKLLPDGRRVSKWADEYKTGGTKYGWSTSDTYTFPEGTQDIEVPFKELYGSFEEFMSEWAGFRERDEKTGRFGYWKNPNAKWDWYQIGGRWSDSLRLKPGANGKHGERSWANKDADAKAGYCDQARACDIDWEYTLNENRRKAGADFDKVWPVVEGQSYTEWHEFVSRAEKKELTWDEAREQYHAQTVIKAVQNALGEDRFWDYGDVLAGVVASKGNRELYVLNTARQNTTTWAILFNGEWIEKGRMGWWASNDATDESKKSYTDRFWDIVNNLPDPAIVSLVDCHI